MAATNPDTGPRTPGNPALPVLRLLHSREAPTGAAQWLLSESVRVIGRAVPVASRPEAVELPHDRLLSEYHARIVAHSNAYFIEDANSKNGTHVNGIRIERHQLMDGDILRLGSCIFLFRLLDDLSPPQLDKITSDSFIVRSPEMQRLLREAGQVANTDLPVLLLGETGTGKEELAHHIHNRSTLRSKEPLIIINCATLTPELADSVLFGHVRGAFTGAASAQVGAFRAAGKGTLFLDELAELPTLVQAKLLRALAVRKVVSVGSTREEDYQARIIAATNCDLDQASREGRFREDLLSRLRAIALQVPPLRKRREDVLPILYARLSKDNPPKLDRHLVETLLLHPWPDNVRGVVNLAQYWRAYFPSAKELQLSNLPAWLAPRSAMQNRLLPSATAAQSVSRVEEMSSHSPSSRGALIELLRQHRGNKAAIARHLGLAERTIGRWLQTHELDFWKWREK